jgi:hypothetical protein
MQRLSRILVALGGAMSVACSDEPPVAPTIAAKPAAPSAADPKLVSMAKTAHDYLKSLNDGSAGAGLTSAQRAERAKHVTEVVKLIDASVAQPSRAALRVAPEHADATALAASDLIPYPGPELLQFPPMFVDAGTFTDLCLGCQKATGFVQTNYPGIVTSVTQATIQVGGQTFSPSSGISTCLGVACTSQIDLSPIVDCRQRPATGTATSTGTFLLRFKIFNIDFGSKNTYASGECAPVKLTVTLGSSAISVGSSTQALSTCVGYTQWSSGTPSVARVDDYGVVTGIGAGTAEISATCNAMRGSAMIRVDYADTDANSDNCDDLMTPAVESCDDATSQGRDPYSVTYTRPGYYGEADNSWFTLPEFTDTYTVVCDVTDWYEWNWDHTSAHYVGTDVNSCWLEPYIGGHH